MVQQQAVRQAERKTLIVSQDPKAVGSLAKQLPCSHVLAGYIGKRSECEQRARADSIRNLPIES